jgi:DNA mismatch repair protein MutS2
VNDGLHFDRLDRWLSERTQTPYGQEILENLARAVGLELERRIDAALAWSTVLGTPDCPQLGLQGDCRDDLTRCERGGLLESEALRDLSALLDVFCSLRVDGNDWPSPITKLTAALGDYRDEAQRLRSSIGADGSLLDSASADLGPLRRNLELARRRHSNMATSLRDELYAGGQLQDDYVTQRRERHVLPVKASAKRQLGGIIHDSSRSGKTAYVEPAELLSAGNAVRQREEEVQQEEVKILERLSQIVRLRTAEIRQDIELLAILDADRCRGAFGKEFEGIRPVFGPDKVELRGLRPPALLLAGLDSVVAVDISLNAEAPVLVISGPNGGGKSVALNASAWAFELAQRGLPIPADSVHLPPPPYRLWPVIGDAADDRQALSTFSGHLEGLRQALIGAKGSGHLVLIDEIASGTEPIAGGAIACGFLETFAKGSAFVIATTHYDPVKHLALEHPKLRAAAVRDRRDLEVAFRLFRDEVGGSHPIKLAIDLGLPEEVIASARHHLDPDRRQRLDALKRQQGEAETLEKLRVNFKQQRQALHDERQEFETLKAKQDKAELKRRSRAEKDAFEIDELRRHKLIEIEALRDELSASIKALRSDSSSRAADGDRLFASLQDLREKTNDLSVKTEVIESHKEIGIGDSVRLFSGGSVGVVEEFRGQNAVVLIDGKLFHMRIQGLQRVAAKPALQKTPNKASQRAATAMLPINASDSVELDLRGLRPFEAEGRIDRFLQQLCDDDVPGRIIHGIGTAVLRQSTRDYLRSGPWKVAFRSGMGSEGGEGVTVVVMEN